MNRTIGALTLSGMMMALMFSASGCKKKVAFGLDCKDDMGCESLHCSPYGNICSKSCNLDSDCGGNSLVCRADDNGFNMCSKAIGNPPNGSCMSPADCDHGHCLHHVGQEDQPGICSALCNTPADCAVPGMKICMSISDSPGEKFCLPGDATTAPSSVPKFGPPPKKNTTVTAPVAPPPAITAAARPAVVIPKATAAVIAPPAATPVVLKPPAAPAAPKKK
jgi:hypothetical protein